VNGVLWPIIELDLGYVRDTWNRTTFDLWEEVSSSSFFTTAVQHRVLREGAALARELGVTEGVAEYERQADNVLCFLQVGVFLLLCGGDG
jgi:glucoamylase